ncbi:MAG: damage-inducible protein [Candidatus Absconditabacteria bacterium]|nr:damage-inducible protein [Candidatus Absconditabacteria bacterium]MDD3868439.1 damage-inducible protein [Candidatus Absconditabacteria bacterium]MDD4714037.1 damage-inducible protein [Candidatus Absconditabacteria bacterium]
MNFEISTNTALTFEDFQHQNGMTYRWASEFMMMLGYIDSKDKKKLLDKTMKAFLNLGIDMYDNIQKADHEGKEDYKLSRYACYIMAMNGDSKILQVARAQNYFAEQTRKFELYSQDTERLTVRSEISEGNKSLSKTITRHGVSDYAKFNLAGYEGMYGMSNQELAEKRGIDKEKLFDHMGRTELAANLFRITQTEERIRKQELSGQYQLESAHRDVGAEVRKFVGINTGDNPENLPTEMPLNEMKKELKDIHKELKKADEEKGG